MYQKCLKLHGIVEMRGLRMIMENPWHEINYTNYFWFRRVTFIDRDRTTRGDLFKKPTGYWFTNCEPTGGCTLQQTPKDKVRSTHIGNWAGRPDTKPKELWTKNSSQAGLCSEERSMISPDYARNFICDFILGIKQTLDPQPGHFF